MKTRQLLLGTVAAISIGGSAQAGWYLGLEGGANWIADNQFDFGANSPPHVTQFNKAVEYDTGWAIMGTVGHAWPSHWRVELEVGYRDNDADLFSSAAGLFLFRSGSMSQFTVMANVLHDFQLNPNMKLSLGGGVGMDSANIDDGIVDESDTSFAWQALAGLSYSIGPNCDLTLTYRYMSAGGPDVQAPHLGHIDSEEFDSLDNHTLSLGVRWGI